MSAPAHLIVAVSPRRFRIGYCNRCHGDTSVVTLVGPKFDSELSARSVIASAARAWYGPNGKTDALTWQDVKRVVERLSTQSIRNSDEWQAAMADAVHYYRTEWPGAVRP